MSLPTMWMIDHQRSTVSNNNVINVIIHQQR